jgi:hypothetical protein
MAVSFRITDPGVSGLERLQSTAASTLSLQTPSNKEDFFSLVFKPVTRTISDRVLVVRARCPLLLDVFGHEGSPSEIMIRYGVRLNSDAVLSDAS